MFFDDVIVVGCADGFVVVVGWASRFCDDATHCSFFHLLYISICCVDVTVATFNVSSFLSFAGMTMRTGMSKMDSPVGGPDTVGNTLKSGTGSFGNG